MSGVRKSVAVDGQVFDLDVHLKDGRLSGTLARDDADAGADETAASAAGISLSVERVGVDRIRLRTADAVRLVTVYRDGDVTYVAVDGEVVEVTDAGSSRVGDATLHDAPLAMSPMTGIVVKVAVAAGDVVSKGGELFIVEAMKMEYVVRAPRDLVVETVSAETGEAVEMGEVLVTFAEDA